MRLLLRVTIIIGYVLFGTFWIKSSIDIVTRNVFFDVFTIEKVKVQDFTYTLNLKDTNQCLIQYKYLVDTLLYTKELKASKSAFDKKVGLNNNNIHVFYNKTFPGVSYLEGWEIKDYYKITFVFFSIFLSLVVFVSFRVDKEKWIKKYVNAIFRRKNS